MKSRRLHLDISEPTHERLIQLRDRTEAASLSEVIRRALATYELLIDRQEGGEEVIVRDQDGSERTIIVT